MAREFDGASNGVITTALTAHATQRTYSIWAQHDSFGEESGRLFCKEATATNLELFAIQALPAFFYRRNWSTTHGQWRWDYPSTGVWHHHCVRYDAGSTANDPSYWRDGASIDGSRVEESTPAGSIATNADAYRVGNRGSLDRDFDGRLAEFAIWDVLLTDGEVRALSRGVSPLRIRPQSLAGFWPIYGAASPEPDFTGNGTATVSVATTAAHAPVQPAFGFDEMWLPRPLPVIDTADQASMILGGLTATDRFVDVADRAVLTMSVLGATEQWVDFATIAEMSLGGLDAATIAEQRGHADFLFKDVRGSRFARAYGPMRYPIRRSS